MRTSDSIAKIAAALGKAMPEIQNATKDAKNPHFRSSYASLSSVLDATKPVLAEHGIVVIQSPGWDGQCTVTTRLLHVSGEWIEGTASSPVAKADPQGVGSAITYLRRYSLAALCGITQEDDDGNAASRPAPAKRPAKVEEVNYNEWEQLRLDTEQAAVDEIITAQEAAGLAGVYQAKDAGRYSAARTFLDDKIGGGS